VSVAESSGERVSVQWQDYPALYQVADSASTTGRRSYFGLSRLELVLVVLGAALGAIAAFIPAQPETVARGFMLLTAIPFVGAMSVRFLNRQRGDDRDWFNGRAVAETIKSQTWRYMLRITPFDNDQTADREFIRGLDAVMRARSTVRQPLAGLPGEAQQITPVMRQVRALSATDRRDLYLRERLRNQAEWYRRKSVENARAAERWFLATVATQAVAVLMAGARVVVPELNLTGLFAALAAAFTAWTQLGRNDELSKSYAMAYQELLLIISLADRAQTDAELAEVVRDGEAAISREHTMWIAKRGEPLPPPEPHE
jgi:hypothetical protein